ncbi:MAG: GNAT family N-acetyltransferase [Ilumatobacteraceae bacterium]
MSARVTTSGAPRNADQRRIQRSCVTATHDGRRVLRTAAVGKTDAEWFERHGFAVVQHLVVLRRDLDDITSLLHHSPVAGVDVSSHTFARRLARRADRAIGDALVALDGTGFGGDWQLTVDALFHACRSTPTHRVFVARQLGVDIAAPLGYAIVGVAYEAAYLQRLVVAPKHRGRRIASTLVVAGMTWARTNGARRMLVNTEPDNSAALALYRSLGFTTDADGLVVLERETSELS